MSDLVEELRSYSDCYDVDLETIDKAADEIVRLSLIISNLNKIRLGHGGTFVVDENGYPKSEVLK